MRFVAARVVLLRGDMVPVLCGVWGAWRFRCVAVFRVGAVVWVWCKYSSVVGLYCVVVDFIGAVSVDCIVYGLLIRSEGGGARWLKTRRTGLSSRFFPVRIACFLSIVDCRGWFL